MSMSTCRRRVLALLLVLVAGLLAAPGCTRPVSEGTGYVRRDGRVIVDGTGRPLLLRGVNLGQWLLWEQWLMGIPFSETTETDLVRNLRSLVGDERTAQFQESLRDAYITRADLEAVAALGFNVVRVPFNHTLLEDDEAPGVYKASGWRRLDDLLDWAEQARVHVVLDLHSAPCGQNPLFIADPDDVLLWESPSCQDRTVALWGAIAARYATRPIVAGWDLLNEPATPRRAADLPDLYRRIIAAVRAVDPNHLVFVEGGAFATDFSMFTGALDANQAYSFHQYLWGTRDAEGDTEATKAVAARHDLPLWMGEFGQDSLANIARQVDRFNADPAIGGWAVWTWKGAPGDRYTPEVRNVEIGPAWSRVITWLDRPRSASRPPAEEAEAGLREYVEAVKLASTRPDEDLIATLGPVASPARSEIDTRMCIGPRAGSDDDGTVLRLWPCNQSPAQIWTRTASATTPLRALGKCAARPAAPALRPQVQLQGCERDDHWTVGVDDQTVRFGGRCLTDPSGTAALGTVLRLSACDGRQAQRWRLE